MSAPANPLVGDTPADTVNNCTQALTAFMSMLSATNSSTCFLLLPILSALEHAASGGEA